LNRVAGEKVGVYGINQGGLGLVRAKYSLKYKSETHDEPRTLHLVIAHNNKKVYGDAEPSLTYPGSGL
ncbi:hypothetical protein, partial [Pseudomonas aeruginosa]|uniref:hypothetical protein n=1 Tax=Pseudomonas aeruginosa TaxID=287 RepID=UPI001C527C0F